MRPAIVIALVCAGLLQDVHVDASPDVRLQASARLVDAAPIPFASTVLGRATHRVQVVLLNPSSERAALAQPGFQWSAERAGIAYVCEDKSTPPRGTIAIGARASIALEATMRCELPLPGDYQIMLRVDAAGLPIAHAKLVVTIAAGANAPVSVPWDPRAWVAVSGTREVRPGRAEARVVIATINGSTAPIVFPSYVARIRLFAPGMKTPLCADQLVAIDLRRSIPPGRVHQAWSTIECPAATEGNHLVDVAVLRPNDEPIDVARYTLRVRTGPLLPLPQ